MRKFISTATLLTAMVLSTQTMGQCANGTCSAPQFQAFHGRVQTGTTGFRAQFSYQQNWNEPRRGFRLFGDRSASCQTRGFFGGLFRGKLVRGSCG